MTRKLFFHMLLVLLSFFQATAWANPSNDCAYENSGVDLNQFRKSKQVTSFEQIEKNRVYIGSLKGVGGFHLQLFSCTHHGAKITLMLGSGPKAYMLKKALDVLSALLFSTANSPAAREALSNIHSVDLSAPLHLEQLAFSTGYSDMQVQVHDVDGVGVLTFSFFGG
jgi:hypothetical protein